MTGALVYLDSILQGLNIFDYWWNMRASQKKIRRASSKHENKLDHSHQVYLSPRKRTRTIHALPKIFAPQGQRFIQHSNLPIPSGQLGLLEGVSGLAVSDSPSSKSPAQSAEVDSHVPVIVSSHYRKRVAQNNRWNNDVIPLLVSPYLNLMRETQNLRLKPQLLQIECTCLASAKKQVLSVLVLHLYSM